MACGQLLRSASVWSHGVSDTGSGDPVAALLCTTLVTQRRGWGAPHRVTAARASAANRGAPRGARSCQSAAHFVTFVYRSAEDPLEYDYMHWYFFPHWPQRRRGPT